MSTISHTESEHDQIDQEIIHKYQEDVVMKVSSKQQKHQKTRVQPVRKAPEQPQKPKQPDQIKEVKKNQKDPYEAITKHETNQDDIVCDICLDGDDFEGDEIVICEMCSAATHQTCYGSEIKNKLPLPDQPWYCARCQELIKNKAEPTAIKCILCPDLKGIMKQVLLDDKKQWAHLICVNWTPEIWFLDPENTKVGGQLNVNRSGLACGKCLKKSGSCVQCDFQNCAKSWHVRCAQQLNVIKCWDEMRSELGNPNNQFETPLFCKEHSETGKLKYKEMGQSGIETLRKKTTVTKVPKLDKSKPIKKVASKSKQSKKSVAKVPKLDKSKPIKKLKSKQQKKQKPVGQKKTAVMRKRIKPVQTEKLQKKGIAKKPVANQTLKLMRQPSLDYSKILNENPGLAQKLMQEFLMQPSQQVALQQMWPSTLFPQQK